MLGLKLSDAELPIACSLCLGSTLCHPHKFKCAAKMWSLMVAMNSIVMSKVDVFPRHTEANVLIKKP